MRFGVSLILINGMEVIGNQQLYIQTRDCDETYQEKLGTGGTVNVLPWLDYINNTICFLLD